MMLWIILPLFFLNIEPLGSKVELSKGIVGAKYKTDHMLKYADQVFMLKSGYSFSERHLSGIPLSEGPLLISILGIACYGALIQEKTSISNLNGFPYDPYLNNISEVYDGVNDPNDLIQKP